MDFTDVLLEAVSEELILAGTMAFCGSGVSEEIGYWNGAVLGGDRDMALVARENTHYVLYALANSAVTSGINAITHTVDVMTWWRAFYMGCIGVLTVSVASDVIFYAINRCRKIAERSK